jgi:hypothetical protein
VALEELLLSVVAKLGAKRVAVARVAVVKVVVWVEKVAE